jgi:hypothetical protein
MSPAQRYNSAARQAHQIIARETLSSSPRPVEARAREGVSNHDRVDAENPYRNPALDNRPDMLKKGIHSPQSLRARPSNLAQMNKLALSVPNHSGITRGMNNGINGVHGGFNHQLHLTSYDQPMLDSAADDLSLLRNIRLVGVVVTLCIGL